MSTKDRLLLENDDGVTRRLFLLEKRRKLLEEERAKYPDDQFKQLEFDRISSIHDDQQNALRRLKEQTSKL